VQKSPACRRVKSSATNRCDRAVDLAAPRVRIRHARAGTDEQDGARPSALCTRRSFLGGRAHGRRLGRQAQPTRLVAARYRDRQLQAGGLRLRIHRKSSFGSGAKFNPLNYRPQSLFGVFGGKGGGAPTEAAPGRRGFT